jgi:histone deacetylase 6
MTYMLSTLAGGKLVVALEVSLTLETPLLSSWSQGGYTLESLSNCALAVGRMLLGEAPPELPPLVASEVESETVWLVAKEQSKYWKNINTKACEPKEGLFTHLSIGRFLSSYIFSRFRRVRIRCSRYVFREDCGWLAPENVLAELLKAHRQDYMYRNFEMLEVPLMHDDVREKFSAQIMCS